MVFDQKYKVSLERLLAVLRSQGFLFARLSVSRLVIETLYYLINPLGLKLDIRDLKIRPSLELSQGYIYYSERLQKLQFSPSISVRFFWLKLNRIKIKILIHLNACLKCAKFYFFNLQKDSILFLEL